MLRPVGAVTVTNRSVRDRGFVVEIKRDTRRFGHTSRELNCLCGDKMSQRNVGVGVGGGGLHETERMYVFSDNKVDGGRSGVRMERD
jgi:hypothetical protein